MAQLLLAAGAEVDSRDGWANTPLAKAVFNSSGDGSLILLLRAAGAIPTALNHHGVSPLSLARTIANYDVAQFFADLPCDGAAYQAAAADERRARQGLVR